MNRPIFSPTPWRIEKTRGSFETTNVFICSLVDPNPLSDSVCQLYVRDGFEEREANAVHIVHCVNSHDDLVKALEDARYKLELYRDEHSVAYVGGVEYSTLVTQINAALAKAKS